MPTSTSDQWPIDARLFLPETTGWAASDLDDPRTMWVDILLDELRVARADVVIQPAEVWAG